MYRVAKVSLAFMRHGMAALLLVCGCDGPSSASSQPATATTTQPASDVHALRSMPYAGFSPEDDEEGDGVIHIEPERVSPGYTLVSVHWLRRADLIDEKGKLVHRWEHEPKGRWDNTDLQSNGDILVTGADTARSDLTDIRYYLLRLNWKGQALWKQYINAHHDVERTPAGKLLTLTFQRRVVPDVHPTVELRDDHLTLVDDSGGILDSFSIYEALRKNPEIFALEPGRPNVYAGRAWVNLLHSNSVEWMHQPALYERNPIYGPENVLVCFRHQNRIAIFHWPTQRVIWAWGAGELDGPHDARVLPTGNILVFDNGLKRRWSRVLEIDPLAGRIVWEYKAPNPRDFYTPTKGSSQRLANGNTLIANADRGQVFEVTHDGRIVWDYRIPDRNEKSERAAIVRAVRYEKAFIEGLPRADKGE